MKKFNWLHWPHILLVTVVSLFYGAAAAVAFYFVSDLLK